MDTIIWFAVLIGGATTILFLGTYSLVRVRCFIVDNQIEKYGNRWLHLLWFGWTTAIILFWMGMMVEMWNWILKGV